MKQSNFTELKEERNLTRHSRQGLFYRKKRLNKMTQSLKIVSQLNENQLFVPPPKVPCQNIDDLEFHISSIEPSQPAVSCSQLQGGKWEGY